MSRFRHNDRIRGVAVGLFANSNRRWEGSLGSLGEYEHACETQKCFAKYPVLHRNCTDVPVEKEFKKMPKNHCNKGIY